MESPELDPDATGVRYMPGCKSTSCLAIGGRDQQVGLGGFLLGGIYLFPLRAAGL